MRTTYQWIKEFVPELTAPAEEVARRLTAAGLEVESVTDLAKGLSGVVVGKLLDVKKHPNADKLTVCMVALTPDASAPKQIVCGATNHKIGDKVPVALPGTVLPGDKKIEKGKIRGEVSEGMLCSEAELGMAAEAPGILILAADAVEGTPIAQALNLADAVFEIGVTPNRGDCLSAMGVAREVAAAFGLGLKRGLAMAPSGDDAGKRIAVTVSDPACPRYIARVIDGVTIAPSPSWMARRLEQCGIRPINNVVDVTNYVMLECGQPLHAFDARTLEGNSIVVRRAKPGETMKTLDGVERKLLSGAPGSAPDRAIPEGRAVTHDAGGEDYDLVIADGKRPVAIAGVMGGEHSGVENDTKTVVLEAAFFDPARVRRSARRHGLHTESSHRFERTVDAGGVDRASVRAAALIAELGKGTIVPGKVDVSSAPLEHRKITLRMARAQSLLGLAGLDAVTTAELLAPLQVSTDEYPDVVAARAKVHEYATTREVVPQAATLHCEIPTFRDDLREEVDLIEEIARRIGYDAIPSARPRSYLTAENVSRDLERSRLARRVLVGLGFQEAVHLPFGSRDEAAKLKLAADDPRSQPVALANPIADDQAVLRGTLLPALLMNLSRNLAHKNADVRVFELRTAFRAKPVVEGVSKLPDESRRIAAVLSGRRAPGDFRTSDAAVDFFDAKGAVEILIEAVCAKTSIFRASSEPFLVAGAQASVECGGRSLGSVGEVHPDVLAAFDAGAKAFVFELDFEAMLSLAAGTPKFAEIPKFPAIERDVALVVDEATEVGAMLTWARQQAKKTLEAVEVFDIYRGEKLPAGKKSVALGMRWRAPEKTLTDDEGNSLQEKLVTALIQQFRAERRT